jgi:8-amino-7-oxononanoate synthase
MNFSKKISVIEQNNLLRFRKIAQSAQSTEMVIDDQKVINFCSNDYLSLANHPKIKEALIEGVSRYGIGSGASHLVSGHSESHHNLEEALAQHTGQQRALLFSSGYSANLGVFSALRDEIDWVLQDKLNHASLIDGNRLIGLPIQRYLHNNLESLEKKLKKQTGTGLIVTDNVFSMDGDRANIEGIKTIAAQSGALLMQDDAHGFGIFESTIPDHSIYMATLGKAAGVMGAFVSGSSDLIEFLIQKSRPYIYTTAISPSICLAILKSLELIKKGEQKEKLFSNINYFKDCAETLDLHFEPSESAIQPLIIGSSNNALSLSNKLFDAGYFVSAIRPPTVPPNTSRLRFTLSANHSFSQIESLLQKVKDVMA